MNTSNFLRAGIATSALLGVFCQSAVASDVTLTFSASNVFATVCSGASQPTCTRTSAGSFVESLTLDSAVLLTTDNGGSGFLDTLATFGFPTASTGNPYTASLQSILLSPPTATTAYSQFENAFDTTSSAGGFASAQIYADQSYDNSAGSSGEFQFNYSLLTPLTLLSTYQDLTTASLFDFVSPLVNHLSGSFFELGTASVLNPVSLAFDHYAYTSYTGDVMLTAVSSVVTAPVPEPSTMALTALGLAALGFRRWSARQSAARA